MAVENPAPGFHARSAYRLPTRDRLPLKCHSAGSAELAVLEKPKGGQPSEKNRSSDTTGYTLSYLLTHLFRRGRCGKGVEDCRG